MNYVRKLSFEAGVRLLLILNVLDAASTHLALHMGIAKEVNPLLGWAFGVDPLLFWLVKFVLVAVVLLMVSRLDDVLARRATLIGNLIYVLLLSVHVYGWLLYSWFKIVGS